jgi:hypothetical protein
MVHRLASWGAPPVPIVHDIKQGEDKHCETRRARTKESKQPLEKEKEVSIRPPLASTARVSGQRPSQNLIWPYILLHNPRPSGSRHAGLYYLSALTRPTFKKVASSALASNPPNPSTIHCTTTPRGPFSLGLSITHPDSLSFSTANCFDKTKCLGLDPLESAQKHTQIRV